MNRKVIHLNKAQNMKRFVFPDGQPHVVLQNIMEADEVTVVCSVTDSSFLLQLLQTANAIDHIKAKKKKLIIPYLMGARYDRLMVQGDSFDLEVIASLINNMQFEQVYLYDVHSEVALKLIHNSFVVTNEVLVKAYSKENAVLICPDKGAEKKIKHYTEWNMNLTETVYCNKSRDVNNGKISLQVMETEKCMNRNCVIIDDICDGGGTFLAIAQQIQPAHLTLIVTHGIFSKGFAELEKAFEKIIVSDSYRSEYDSAIVQVVPFEFSQHA
jgi:ribose-phosphate pyrophosphokinase